MGLRGMVVVRSSQVGAGLQRYRPQCCNFCDHISSCIFKLMSSTEGCRSVNDDVATALDHVPLMWLSSLIEIGHKGACTFRLLYLKCRCSIMVSGPGNS